MTDDGFIYYVCRGECGERKIAALFTPAEIASGHMHCRTCTGEIGRNPRNRGRSQGPLGREWGKGGFTGPAYPPSPVRIASRSQRA